jgi:hypothetical protein
MTTPANAFDGDLKIDQLQGAVAKSGGTQGQSINAPFGGETHENIPAHFKESFFCGRRSKGARGATGMLSYTAQFQTAGSTACCQC